MATKLHELLAVNASLKTQADATRTDLQNTFEKKRTHFSEAIVTFKPNTEGAEPKVESRMSIQTTVEKELDWIGEKLGKAMDAAHQINVANTIAKADVVLEDGTIILKGVPATSLLELEKRVEEIRTLVHTIPTLDPTKDFKLDPQRPGIYKARDVEKQRTEKRMEFPIVAPATDKHPAQVKEVSKDVPIGEILQQEWSSMFTVGQKGDMLDRVEDLSRAVRKARARANEIEVDVKTNTIGGDLLGFIFRGE
jgi:hypothetical protein